MKTSGNIAGKQGLFLAAILIAITLIVCPATAGTLKVKKGGEGTEVATKSIRPHDYTLVAKNIPCIYHFFSDNMARMKFTDEQKKLLKSIDNSPEERTLYSRAERIQALEFALRKKVYSNEITSEEVAVKLHEIGDLRFQQTVGFMEMQKKLLDMLSPAQYQDLKAIITEKGLF